MKYLFLILFCLPAFADTAFLGACQTRVNELRQATGGLSCSAYKQDCISGTGTGNASVMCDGSECSYFVFSSFAGQGNCTFSTKLCCPSNDLNFVDWCAQFNRNVDISDQVTAQNSCVNLCSNEPFGNINHVIHCPAASGPCF